MDILLIGANGQLGWEIARRAATKNLSFHATVQVELDVTNREAVLRYVDQLKPKMVINAAAYTAVDKAESDPDAAYAVNRNGPTYLAEVCSSLGLPLIHMSTDYVFDGTKTEAYTEKDPVAPLGIYGSSKVAGEDAVRKICPHHIILRTSWVYGVHGQNFVKKILRAGAESEVLRIVDDQYGCPTFAGDLADEVLTIANQMIGGTVSADAFGTFHCTNQGQTTWCGFARKVFEFSEPRLSRIPKVDAIPTAAYPGAARRPGNSVLNCDRLARIFGIQLRPWEKALPEMLSETLQLNR